MTTWRSKKNKKNGYLLRLLLDRGVWSKSHAALPHVALRCKLDALLGDADDNRLANSAQVAADALKLARRELDDSIVLCVL